MIIFTFINYETVLCKHADENSVRNKADSIDQNRAQKNNLRRLIESKVPQRFLKIKKIPTVDNPVTLVPSMTPTNASYSNPVLNFTGQCTSDKPCQICEGDCDNDSECEIGE